MNNENKTCGRMPLWLHLRYNPRMYLKVPRKRLKSDYLPVSINRHGGEPMCEKYNRESACVLWQFVIKTAFLF